MHTYCIQTLVDIGNPGDIRLAFPFQTTNGELVNDKETLDLVRNQSANFITTKQLLQMRSNIIWDLDPQRIQKPIKDYSFGSFYNEGKQNIWIFGWQVEQAEVYSAGNNSVGGLEDDFHLVPINSFCRESVTFPQNVFNTKDPKFKNTVFMDLGDVDK